MPWMGNLQKPGQRGMWWPSSLLLISQKPLCFLGPAKVFLKPHSLTGCKFLWEGYVCSRCFISFLISSLNLMRFGQCERMGSSLRDFMREFASFPFLFLHTSSPHLLPSCLPPEVLPFTSQGGGSKYLLRKTMGLKTEILPLDLFWWRYSKPA